MHLTGDKHMTTPLTPAEVAALVRDAQITAHGLRQSLPSISKTISELATALLALQDVRRDALEEAAKVCDDEVDASESNPAIKSQWSRCAEWCAAAIRALAASEKEKR
jgi:hypothetical protein